ncbi:MAG: hypothetical protein NZ523_05305 [Elioraea sp.]|nr:hypothetical protein [Elioraea sp.]
MIVVAREGARDAIFDVPAQLMATAPRDSVVSVVLTSDPEKPGDAAGPRRLAAGGPGHPNPAWPGSSPTRPKAIRLGSTVIASIRLERGIRVSLQGHLSSAQPASCRPGGRSGDR